MNKLISKNERIFVAGASGMAGSAICRSILNYGYGLKNNGGLLLSPTRKELDLTNKCHVEEWFFKNKPTIVILAAAKVGGIVANSTYPADFLLENIKIQTNIIECSWKFGVKRFLFLGSSCIYPKNSNQPICEESLLNGELEDTNLGYALAKITGIKLCELLRNQYGLDAISLMPTNLYGPNDNYHPNNSHVMASLIRKFSNAVLNSEKEVVCWGTGKPLREFMHVDDLGNAAIFVLENWSPSAPDAPVDNSGKKLTFLNVGTGQDISIKDLSLKIAEITRFNGKILWDNTKPDGVKKKLLDISRIKNLGWGPKININEGIKNTIKEYKKFIAKNIL